MIFINLDTIVAIKVTDFIVDEDWYYRVEPALFFGLIKSKEYWCNKRWESSYLNPKYYTIIDNSVYSKPKVIIQFANRLSETFYFETHQEALDYARAIYNKPNSNYKKI